MKRLRIINCFLCLMAACALVLGGCGRSEEDSPEQKQYLYYRSEDGKSALAVEIEPDEEDTQTAVEHYLEALKETPDGGQALLPEAVSLLDYQIGDGQVVLDFSKSYYDMDQVTELLVRSGYVRSLTQIEAVSGVAFKVENEDLTDSDGHAIGVMTADSFIENAGKSVNNYQYNEITLYFTDADGHTLIPEGRAIYYSSNKSLEWAVVERLIAGPKVSGNYPTLQPETQILSVTSQDGTCYVNLDQTFVQPLANVDDEVTVYSLVNSLIRNCDISRVQISVNGINNVVYDDEIDLSQSFEMNGDLLQ